MTYEPHALMDRFQSKMEPTGKGKVNRQKLILYLLS